MINKKDVLKKIQADGQIRRKDIVWYFGSD